ncbi:MAG: hypothetical protein ACKPKO_56920, partial [Candidatus Fonsibacter sp.]
LEYFKRVFLKKEVNKITGRTEDTFQIIINKLKELEEFKTDNNFWLEYEKLDHQKLGIPNLENLKNNYKEEFENRTWYDILDLRSNYYNLTDLKHILESKYAHITNYNETVLEKNRKNQEYLNIH